MSREGQTPSKALATTPSQQFQTEYQFSVAYYGKFANEIWEFSFLYISDKLIAFFNGYSNLQNCNPEMARKIERVVIKCQEIEVEAQKYVVKARNLTQENKLVAQNVLDGKQYYRPESILKNFKRTAENLDKAFTAVAEKHSEVERSIASSHHPVTKGFASQAGSVARFRQGAISTASEAKERLKNVQEMYEFMVEFLKRFNHLIKNHKKLLSNISACVSQLPMKYEELGEDYKSVTLTLYQIDLFKNTCDNIIKACDMYLTTFPLK